MDNLPSGWKVYAAYGKSYDVGFIIQSQTTKKGGERKPIAVPTKALRDMYEGKRFVLATSDDGKRVAMFEAKTPDAVVLAGTGMHALSSALKQCGYDLVPGVLYPIVKMSVERGFEILNKPQKCAGIRSYKRKAKSEASAEPTQAPIESVKEYPLPGLSEGNPDLWAQACVMMARAKPKSTIEDEIGLSVASCRHLEVHCRTFISALKEHDKACNRDMAKGLTKAVIESWERQLRSKAS